MATTDKLQGTCSVCLRTMQLHGDYPIRHGFSAVGVRHGQHSGYHTGPCSGTQFPHLGISTEGTVWALGHAQKRLTSTNAELDRLAGHPDLTWYPTKSGSHNKVRGGLPDLERPVTLRYGEDAGFPTDGRPTYAWEHKKRVVVQENIKNELERAIAAYEEVLADWSPEKYPTTGAPKKLDVVHMERPITSARTGQTIVGTLCRSGRRGRVSMVTTSDPSKVTCKKCRAALGLPPL